MARQAVEVTVEEVEHFMAYGDKPAHVAQRLGMTPDAIAKALYRAGRPEIANTFERIRTRPTHPCADCGAPVSSGPRFPRCRPCGHAQRIKTRYGNDTQEIQP